MFSRFDRELDWRNNVGMKRTATVRVRLEADLMRVLDQMCRRSGRNRSEVMRDILKRHLAASQFEILRRRAVPFVAARGYLTDEDVFRIVS